MLFIIVIDMHIIFIARKKEGKKVGGLITYLVDGGVSILQYANDSIIFLRRA
jgi:hypothetical protein